MIDGVQITWRSNEICNISNNHIINIVINKIIKKMKADWTPDYVKQTCTTINQDQLDKLSESCGYPKTNPIFLQPCYNNIVF